MQVCLDATWAITKLDSVKNVTCVIARCQQQEQDYCLASNRIESTMASQPQTRQGLGVSRSRG